MVVGPVGGTPFDRLPIEEWVGTPQDWDEPSRRDSERADIARWARAFGSSSMYGSAAEEDPSTLVPEQSMTRAPAGREAVIRTHHVYIATPIDRTVGALRRAWDYVRGNRQTGAYLPARERVVELRRIGGPKPSEGFATLEPHHSARDPSQALIADSDVSDGLVRRLVIDASLIGDDVADGLVARLSSARSDLFGDDDYGVFIAHDMRRMNEVAHGYKERAGTVAEVYATSKLDRPDGRTLYGGAKAAVEGKRQRLETFAEIYAGYGGTDPGADQKTLEHARAKAARAVGITTERTIADYVSRVENGGTNPESDNRTGF
jgi:hypothetical protein